METTGHEGVEFIALDALFAQVLIVPRAHITHAADVVVENAHLDALRRLGFEDIEDRAPHDAVLDDEVFEEDVLLRALQVEEEVAEEVFARGIVLCIGAAVDDGVLVLRIERARHRRPAPHARDELRIERARYRRPAPHARDELLFGERRAGELVRFLFERQELLPLPARGAVVGKDGIDGDAEGVEGDDAQEPQDFCLGHHVAVDDVDGGRHDDDPPHGAEDEVDPLRPAHKDRL